MAGDSWVIDLTAVAATGNLQQLYPVWAPVGTAIAVAVPGNQIRKPTEGYVGGMQIKTDNSNAGYIEVWDLNGADAGADVSSLAVVTNAQLVILQALGKAKLIWNQNFTATSGASTPASFGKKFVHGLAARFVNAGPTGACTINIDVDGGFRLNETAGL